MWKSDTCLVSRGAEESARHLLWGACGKAGALGDCYRRSDPPGLHVANSGKIRTALALEPELVFPPQNVL